MRGVKTALHKPNLAASSPFFAAMQRHQKRFEFKVQTAVVPQIDQTT